MGFVFTTLVLHSENVYITWLEMGVLCDLTCNLNTSIKKITIIVIVIKNKLSRRALVSSADIHVQEKEPVWNWNKNWIGASLMINIWKPHVDKDKGGDCNWAKSQSKTGTWRWARTDHRTCAQIPIDRQTFFLGGNHTSWWGSYNKKVQHRDKGPEDPDSVEQWVGLSSSVQW